ncbi:MAG TPA: hypothetical protein VEV83_10030, partial [Parafilimonas sp.]|nr:hypothetical protein [Parafilimonas sp.]
MRLRLALFHSYFSYIANNWDISNMDRKVYLGILCSIISIAAFSQKTEQQDKERRQQERKQHIADLIKREEEGALIFDKQFALG